MINKLFVYGTLHNNPGNRYSRFLERNSNYLGIATIRGKLYNIGRYPGAVVSHEGDDNIKGYLYSLNDVDSILNKLDEYEGYKESSPGHSLFVRKKVLVLDNFNKKHWAWIYWYNKDTGKKMEIENGDYIASKEKNRQNESNSLRTIG